MRFRSLLLIALQFVGGAAAVASSSIGATSACILAFPENDYSARVRAGVSLSRVMTEPIAPDIAVRAMQSNQLIRLASLSDHALPFEGFVVAVKPDRLSIETREGARLEYEFKNVRFRGLVSPEERQLRLDELKRLEKPDVQKRIEELQAARESGREVEVRLPVHLNGAQMTFIYRGLIDLVDSAEVWATSSKGLKQQPDQISLWLKRNPEMEIEYPSADGSPPRIEKPFVHAPSSVRNKFPLTGYGAVTTEDLRIIPKP